MGLRARRWSVRLTCLAVVVATAVFAAASAGAGPKAIRTCSTAALKSAVAAGGSWVFQCSGTIIAPKPALPPKIELGKGFEVRKSLTLDVAQGDNVTLQTGQTSLPDNSTEAWRIFTVFPGVTLTLRDLMLSGNAPAPDGGSNTTDTSGAPGADGGPGVSGEKGVDGGLGSPGGAGAIAQGGAIYNQGTVNLATDQFDGVNVQGGKGGNGTTGGNGGNGGGGGQADPGPQAVCQSPNSGPSVYYTQEGGPGGGGGNGGETGVGMAGGFGGLAQGGAIYNQGKLNVSDTTFQGDTAQGGLGGDGGAGGDGGGGGDGADGYGAGDGGDGGHGADGAPAGPGGGGMGGAIFNVGTATLFNSQFSSDVAEGGNSGNGGNGGKGGDGGGGGSGDSYESCDGGFVHEHTTADGSGGNGGGGSNGGKGAAGGTALGGAVYNEGHLALFDSSFSRTR